MYCPYCDARIKRGESCPNCGEPIEISERSRVVALLFSVLFGMFGLQDVYTEHYAGAAVKCIISLAFCWTLYVPIVVWVWSMTETINLLRGKRYDADLRVLK